MAKAIYVAIYENKDYSFKTWNDCKKFVDNKKNIVYRGFDDLSEAQDFVLKNIKKQIPFDLQNVAYAYVDGSVFVLSNGSKVYGYGLAVVKNGNIIYEDSDAATGDETSESYQIGGELQGALKGVQYAIDHGEERVIIVYDYMGIEMWANGTWKPKKQFVIDYVEQMQKYMEQINIDFIHVNSHINNGSIESCYNNRADELAKNACKNFNGR